MAALPGGQERSLRLRMERMRVVMKKRRQKVAGSVEEDDADDYGPDGSDTGPYGIDGADG